MHMYGPSNSAKVGSIQQCSIVLVADNGVKQLDLTVLSKRRHEADMSVGEGDQLLTGAK